MLPREQRLGEAPSDFSKAREKSVKLFQSQRSLRIRHLFAYAGIVPNRQCLVLVPVKGGHVDYTVDASSSMDAARQAIALHRSALSDDCVLTVVVNGRSPLLHGWREHNETQPTFRHRVGAIRGNGQRSQAS